MSPSEWIALITLLCTLVGTAAVLYAQLRVVVAHVASLTKKIEEMASSIRRLWELWDNRPCEAHTVEMANLKERVTAVEAAVRK